MAENVPFWARQRATYTVTKQIYATVTSKKITFPQVRAGRFVEVLSCGLSATNVTEVFIFHFFETIFLLQHRKKQRMQYFFL